MALQLGHNAWLGVADEVTWGTHVAPTEHMRIISHSVQNNTPFTTRPTLGNPVGVGLVRGIKSTGGDVALEVMYEGCESLLAYCFGIPAISAPIDTTAYSWTFTPKAALGVTNHVAMSMRCTYDTLASDFDGNKVSSLTWSMAKDQNLQLTASVGGRGWVNQGTPGSPSYPTDRPVKEGELVMTYDSTAVVNVQSFSVTMNNALSFDRASLGSGYILEPQRNDLISITGSWTGDMISAVPQGFQDAGTVKDLEFAFTSPLLAGAATEPFSYTITLPTVYLTGDTPTVDSAGVVQQTVNFQAVYEGAAAISVVVVNQKATGVGDGL